MKSSVIYSAVIATALLGSATSFANNNSSVRFTALLEGANEVGTAGDADGTGTAVVRLNRGRNQICYSITVANVADVIAAHIHEAPAGSNGPVVHTLMPPTTGTSQGCITVTPDLLQEIDENPNDYYVNVHSTANRTGAVRGQLSR